MNANIFLGIGLHALGGIAAATCFVPQKGTARWSHQSFWILMCLFSWFIVPLVVGFITVPHLAKVISETPLAVLFNVTFLGACYGFGGMAFALAIRHIGFSLTYAMAIGISAVLGTIVPALIKETLLQDMRMEGGGIVYAGLAVAIIGVALCGCAGVFKENHLSRTSNNKANFDIRKGLFLVITAGLLSAVFGCSLEAGASMDVLANKYGAGIFQGNAKLIFATGGAFFTNLVWFSIVHTKEKTWGEYLCLSQGKRVLLKNFLLSVLAGILWYGQFFFYGVGHVYMGEFQFISWGIHMAMLIFFSFGIGLLFREWQGVCKKTLRTLFVGLLVLLASFGLITCGSYFGQQAKANSSVSGEAQRGH